MYDYFHFMWMADIVLMDLGTQAVFHYGFMHFSLWEKKYTFYNHITLLAELNYIADRN